ncbi:MAG: DUF3369 domain-containing protein [Cellvibrionaceae bacterium]
MGIFKKSSDTNTSQAKTLAPGWKVLIVDDEPEVHNITRLALDDFEFEGKPIELLSAYSGAEGQELIQFNPDIALIYLDVVMETDNAGLEFVKFVREELGNPFVRIVLRTGQPGAAPERDVIINYDINDYREKTSFDSTKLFTSTYSGLRAYQDITAVEASRTHLDRYRLGLEDVIKSSADLFEIRSLEEFSSELLEQLKVFLHIDPSRSLDACHGWVVTCDKAGAPYSVLASLGNANQIVDTSEQLPDYVLEQLDAVCKHKKSLTTAQQYVGYLPSKTGKLNLIYLDGITALDELDKRLIQVLSSNVTIAFDNLYLDKEIFDTQTEVIEILGDVVENRSLEAANHVKRVSHLSRLLGKLSGMSDEDVDNLFMASPMHDVGKVAIPDSILLKQGKLEPEEWEIMKTHAEIGQRIFSQSKRPGLQAAAIVAGQHHEKFDGSGYPKGLKGEDIHIYGRIVAITDVFDALVHERCYKKAWPMEKAIELLNDQKGKHFDPHLVALFLDNIEAVNYILKRYPD